MVLITVRVRTNVTMLRVSIDDTASIRAFKQQLQGQLRASTAALSFSKQPKGAPVADSDTLKGLGLKNGDMLHLVTAITPDDVITAAPATAAAAAASSGAGALSSTGKVTLQRGRIVVVDDSKMDEGAASTAKLSSRCKHGPKGACEHCRPLEKPADGTAPAAPDIEWLCTHPPHQMCTNCAPDATGKPKAGSMCLHGPGGRCVHCAVPDDPLNKKHMSFDEFLEQQRALCKHEPSARCVYCIPPSDVSYTIRPGCTRHKPFPLGLCSDCQPPAVVLNRQKYRHVDTITVHQRLELERFVQFWLSRRLHRVAFLYGTYVRGAHGVKSVVQSIYEPPQVSGADGFTLLPDPKEATVNRIAAALGLQRVGMIFTQPKLDCFLSSKHLRVLAQQQNKYRSADGPGSRFASIAVMCESSGGVVPEGCMASDMLMALERAGVVGESKVDEKLKLRDPVGREYIPSVVGKPDKTMDVEFFVVQMPVTVPTDAPAPLFVNSQFPIENRREFGEPQTPAAVKAYLDSKKRESETGKLADFHLLLYLAELLDVETAIVAAEAVKDKRPTPEGITVILQGMLH